MGLRAIIGAGLLLGSSGVVAFAACRGATPGRPATSPSSATAPAPIEPVASAPSPAESASAASAAEELQAAVRAARACEAPVAMITNRPDGGVVFNNAMTSADAGSIDRGQAVIDALGKQTDAFRCCFDVAGGEGEQRVMLTLELAPDGSVKAASVDRSRSTLTDDVAIACFAAVAHDVTYPSSPSDQPTVVEYPLVAHVRGANEQSSKPR